MLNIEVLTVCYHDQKAFEVYAVLAWQGEAFKQSLTLSCNVESLEVGAIEVNDRFGFIVSPTSPRFSEALAELSELHTALKKFVAELKSHVEIDPVKKGWKYIENNAKAMGVISYLSDKY